MAAQATFDKSRELNFYARINETGVPIVLTFVNSNASPYAIDSKEWEARIKQSPSSTENLFVLDEGGGLTVIGDDDNKLQIDLSQANASQRPVKYFIQIFSVAENKTWFSGWLNFHDGVFDGFENDETITIYENGSEITITISGDSSISVLAQTTTATLTPSPTYDAFELTAQAEALTIANPSTAYPNFDGFIIRIKDNATARALTFGNKYRAQGEALPTTTMISKVMIIVCLYDSTSDEYDTKYSEEV